jgi:uncharacterized protein YcbK (DUF882 family)
MKLTDNFWLSEFKSNDGEEMPENVFENINIVAEQLQELRDVVCVPIKVTSGYRSPSHNEDVGGVSNSQHLYGKAADIQVENYKPREIYNLLNEMMNNGEIVQGGLGLYDTFVHYDIRGYKARW